MTSEVEQGMKDLNDFLDDTQEEIMDALLYIQAAKKCLGDKIIYSYPDEEEKLEEKNEVLSSVKKLLLMGLSLLVDLKPICIEL